MKEGYCEHGYDGDCCCNCINQVKIMCHPWNGNSKEFGFLEDKIKVGKGNINEQLAWGCTLFIQEENMIIYSDRKHGICECHLKKTNKNNDDKTSNQRTKTLQQVS